MAGLCENGSGSWQKERKKTNRLTGECRRPNNNGAKSATLHGEYTWGKGENMTKNNWKMETIWQKKNVGKMGK